MRIKTFDSPRSLPGHTLDGGVGISDFTAHTFHEAPTVFRSRTPKSPGPSSGTPRRGNVQV